MDAKGRTILLWGLGASMLVFGLSLAWFGLERWGVVPATAVAMGLFAGVLAWLGMMHDPYAGEARCPECEYDMRVAIERNASKPQCPECGHIARDQKELVTAPKRWRWVAVSLALYVCAMSGPSIRGGLNNGAWTSVPTWALIVALPASPVEAWEEVERRFDLAERTGAGTGTWLTRWQHALLASRCERAVESQRSMVVRLAALDMLLRLEPESSSAVRAFRFATRGEDQTLADFAMKRAHGDWLGRELAMVIDDHTIATERRADAIWTARIWKIRDTKLLEAILRAITDPEPTVRDAAADTLQILQQAWVDPSICPQRYYSGGGLGHRAVIDVVPVGIEEKPQWLLGQAMP